MSAREPNREPPGSSDAWSRPVEGRAVSGVGLWLAERTGISRGAARAVLVLTTLFGVLAATACAIFDHALFEGGLGPGARRAGIAAGLLAASSYPLLALFLRERGRPRKWDFGSSLGAIVLLVAVGQAVGFLLEPYWTVAKDAWQERGALGLIVWPGDYFALVGVAPKDVVLGLFFVSAGSFVVLQRRSVARFFRSMHTGVTLVSLTLVAITAGVLVPQIDGFEDPERRVDLAREREDYELFREHGFQKLPANLQDRHQQYEAFRWAEGYFLYHLLHLYGLGMPDAALSPRMEEGLERFGRKYGSEEGENRQKQMLAALSGQEKIGEIGAFIQAHEPTFWRAFEVSTLLHLNRTYKSHWFASLLVLLGVAVTFNTIRGGWRTFFTIQRLGFFTVHMGILTLLLGGLVSKLFTDRGILHLDEREGPRDTYFRHFDPDKRAQMPFAVGLEHFAREDWLALEVHFLDEEFSSRPPRHTLWEGRELELDHVEREDAGTRPRLAITVREIHDRARIGLPHLRAASDTSRGEVPAAELVVATPPVAEEIPAAELNEERMYLLPLDPARWSYRDPGGAFRLAASYGEDPSTVFPPRELGLEPRLGTFEVRIVGEDVHAPLLVPARLGTTVEVGGGFRLRVVDASADFGPGRGDRKESTHPLPLAEQPYRFAAVWIDLLPPGDGPPERRLVLEAIDPVEHGQQAGFFYSQVEVRLDWDPWSAPGPRRHVLHWSPEEKPRLYAEDGEESGTPIEVGEPFTLGRSRIVATRLLDAAAFEPNVEFLAPSRGADGWDADFYADDPRGAVLEVVRDPGTPAERVEEVRMATVDEGGSNFWLSEDESFYLHLLENSEMLPFEWRSVLKIYEPDASGRLQEVDLGPEKDREIRVNDYFTYRGYRFFQTNAIPEIPTYSGVGVVYDPGIPIVLLGMYTIIAGTTIAFLVRPVVLAGRTRKKRAAKERASDGPS